MAKQTFTTGQVLTAAQMTSLQQTAMGGGSTTAKTVSYTLVAADAGTVVQMNSASATTITVNTALFSAGDTVQIQNIGAGVCTVTAGTATVNTAGSLALAQYEGGQLYFNSTGAAVFFDVVQAASAGGGMTLLSTTSLSGISTTISSISGSYIDLRVYVVNWLPSVDDNGLSLRINSDTGTNYTTSTALNSGSFTMASSITLIGGIDNVIDDSLAILTFPYYANSTTWKNLNFSVTGVDSTAGTAIRMSSSFSGYKSTSAIDSLTFFTASGTLTGTVLIYGVK